MIRKIPQWEYKTRAEVDQGIQSILNEMGDLGWELCGYEVARIYSEGIDNASRGAILIFKRPKKTMLALL